MGLKESETEIYQISKFFQEKIAGDHLLIQKFQYDPC